MSTTQFAALLFLCGFAGFCLVCILTYIDTRADTPHEDAAWIQVAPRHFTQGIQRVDDDERGVTCYVYGTSLWCHERTNP